MTIYSGVDASLTELELDRMYRDGTIKDHTYIRIDFNGYTVRFYLPDDEYLYYIGPIMVKDGLDQIGLANGLVTEDHDIHISRQER